jgi:hypothetical protein
MDLGDTFYSEEESVVLSSSERFWATDGRLTSSTRDKRSRMRSVSRSYRDNPPLNTETLFIRSCMHFVPSFRPVYFTMLAVEAKNKN